MSVELRFQDLFPTRIWQTDLPMLEPIREQLIADIWELLDHPLPGQPGLQTPGDLQFRTEPWWVRCFEVITAVMDTLAADLAPRWRSRSIFSWGLGYRRLADYDHDSESQQHLADLDNFRALGFGHTHTSATFSCVLYLQVPPEMTDSGATVFRDPQYALHRRLGAETKFRLLPKELRLVVFPGYLEHYPEPADLPEPWRTPRLIISADYCYY